MSMKAYVLNLNSDIPQVIGSVLVLFIQCGHKTQQCDSSVNHCSLCAAEVNEKIKVPYIMYL